MRRLRSLLFVPGDQPERFAKAVASGADVAALGDTRPDALLLPKAEGAASVMALNDLFGGALALDGRMIDRPHLIQARPILDMVKVRPVSP